MKKLFSEFRQALGLPRVTISLCGGGFCDEVYAHFTKRHPRLFLVRNKEIGIALIDLATTFDAYLQGGAMTRARQFRRRCQKKEYQCRKFDPAEHIAQIMDVNSSEGVRQGRQMASEYLDQDAVLEFHRQVGENWGVFNAQGELRGYVGLTVCGESTFVSRIMGHSADLNEGIMYFLVTEIVGDLIRRHAETGQPRWISYDTFFGASGGLRLFKRHLRFVPYNVTWKRG